jgi:Cu-Zn family superoxide dismutase
MQYARALRRLTASAIAVGSLAFVPTVVANVPTASDTASSGARAVVRDVNNNVLGVVLIQSTRGGKLLVTGRLTRLGPGFHGFHIHATGVCDPTGATPYASAGGHLNPAGTTHGQHAGDLPSLLVTDDGATITATETDNVTLAQIFDADGSAFIVHALPDNLANIPARYESTTTGLPGPDEATLATGDSGGRVACGVITR